ncbi:flagellar basal body rod protein FlgG [Clostridium sp. C105KSO13]|nr:flagellar basal body rod protein FlgG [Clostridium sp. C105KSO13]
MGVTAIFPINRPVSYTHLRAHETSLHLVCRPLLETKNPQIAGATGTIIQGAIEASNVDIAEEFTEMIIASRFFLVNSKTTSKSYALHIVGSVRCV